MNVRSILVGLAFLATASAAVAPASACRPSIEKAWIRAAPPGATMLAGYATVRHACAKGVDIIGVASHDFAMSRVHETVLLNGMSRMRQARSTLVPAHGELRFEPGGKHLMLMHPKRSLKPGDKVKVMLKLADGRRIASDFSVRKNPPK